MTQYTEKDLTPFFPHDVKPMRAGWYHRDWGFASASCDWFDGNNWFNGGSFNDKSNEKSNFKLKWRGLRFDPSAEAI